MAELKILVSYNFTANDEKALNFIIDTFSNRKDVQVTIFNTYTPFAEIDVKENPELGKMRDGMVFLANELREKEEGLKSLKASLIQKGFSDNQIDYNLKKKTKPVSDEIIDTVLQGGYNVLVLSHLASKVTRFFARSVHNKALSVLKDVTVCIAT